MITISSQNVKDLISFYRSFLIKILICQHVKPLKGYNQKVFTIKYFSKKKLQKSEFNAYCLIKQVRTQIYTGVIRKLRSTWRKGLSLGRKLPMVFPYTSQVEK